MQISKFNLYIIFSFVALFGIGYKVISPHEGNFYRSVVALTISRWFAVALTNAAFALLLGAFWTTVWVFFQKLHPLESSNLQEKCAYFLFEAIFGLSMTKGSITAADGVVFAITLAFAMMHTVLVKRMNMLEEAAMTTTKRRIVSVSLLTACLFVIDASVCLWLGSMIWGDKTSSESGAQTVNIGGRTVQIQHNPENAPIFGRSTGILMLLLLDWALNVAQCVTATTKLALMSFAARFPSEVTNSVRFYVEIVTEILKCALYIGFGGMLMQEAAMPLHLIHQILSNIKRIAILAKDFVQHRKRMKWIEQVDVPTEEQLAQDCFCNICRDEVVNPQLSRILPCSHLFHVDCLAKWLERNRDCPYCQRDVEQMVNQYVAAKKRAEQQPPTQPQTQPQPQQQQAQTATAENNNNNDSTAATAATTANKPNENPDVERLQEFVRRHAAKIAVEAQLNNHAAAVATTHQNQNQQEQQQQPQHIHRQVSVDPQTGRIADESALREMYEQYRAVALKRKEQERMLSEAAAIALVEYHIREAQKNEQKEQKRQAVAAAKNNNNDHLVTNSKMKTSNPRKDMNNSNISAPENQNDFYWNDYWNTYWNNYYFNFYENIHHSKTTTTTTTTKQQQESSNNNKNNNFKRNGNDDDDAEEEISFDDDEEEFVLPPKSNSNNSQSASFVQESKKDRFIITAYERYQRAIDDAKKQLDEALALVTATKKTQKSSPSSSSSIPTNATTTKVVAADDQQQQPLPVAPSALDVTVNSISTKTDTNIDNAATTTTTTEHQQQQQERKSAALMASSVTPIPIDDDDDDEKNEGPQQHEQHDLFSISMNPNQGGGGGPSNEVMSNESFGSGTTNSVFTLRPVAPPSEPKEEPKEEKQVPQVVNNSPTKIQQQTEENNNNNNNSPAAAAPVVNNSNDNSFSASPSASMESPTSSSTNMMMVEGDREESASEFIRRQAQERYLARKRQLQLEKEQQQQQQSKSPSSQQQKDEL